MYHPFRAQRYPQAKSFSPFLATLELVHLNCPLDLTKKFVFLRLFVLPRFHAKQLKTRENVRDSFHNVTSRRPVRNNIGKFHQTCEPLDDEIVIGAWEGNPSTVSFL